MVNIAFSQYNFNYDPQEAGVNKIVTSTNYPGEKTIFFPNSFENWSVTQKYYYLKEQTEKVNN